MNVAIIGSKSWIAGDLAKRLPYNLHLFHRGNMGEFGTQRYNVIINCIGNARNANIGAVRNTPKIRTAANMRTNMYCSI